ncbi:MAG TPA: alpha/beta hydrolase [Candidatus Binatia bacterium]|jgi:pimeloyl-ACP methyl ester carboxylesterase
MSTATVSNPSSSPHLWRSPELGECRVLDLPPGPLEYFERGRGPAIVFAHGWLANANLWRKVVTPLAGRYRCLTLDLPLGSHRVPVRADADLTPAGCGALIADAIDALGLDDVTLVGNDSGGCYSQVATAARPRRIGRLVLNSCETLYDEFPPEPFTSLPLAAANVELLGQMLSGLEDRAARHTPAAYGLLWKRPVDDRVTDTYALPCLRSREVLRDVAKVMSSASSAPLHEAGRKLVAAFRRAVRFAWSPEDRVFPIAHAERYASELADGRVGTIDDAYSFTPEDQPLRLAELIDGWARA